MAQLQKGDKKLINAWTFYDWANSSYPLVITTAIFPIFYEAVTSVKNEAGQIISDKVTLFGCEFINTELYSYVVALSFVIVSLISPVLSGIADYSGNKKRFMQFFCFLGSFSCASLFFFSKEHLGFGMLSILLASVGFWGSLVFYNAYLPEIAFPQDHDKISAKGFGMGYFGSAILLILNLVAIKAMGMPAKYSFISVAVWWIGFAQITFARLPNGTRSLATEGNIVLKGFRELAKVWDELKMYKQLKRYLIAFFIYSMGVQTVMLMAVLFAKKEIAGLEDGNLIISVLLIQFVGILGAFLFSRLSNKIGNIKALGVSLFIWIAICICTYQFVYTPNAFYVIACSVGLVMGGIQALSRSTYSKLLPIREDNASFFSFYDVCEKVGIVIGMLSFGAIEGVTGGMRNSILALITFFIVGFLVLLTIPKTDNVR
ncbi:MAG: major facilitator superfamily permease [Bacteroidota bacterium]|jgi:UMF1 family MFS transporter|nr:major facilitator superfamily permease [Bacteroidota bacterium]